MKIKLLRHWIVILKYKTAPADQRFATYYLSYMASSWANQIAEFVLER